MSIRFSSRQRVSGLGILLVSTFALAGCAGPPLSSPVGEWVAVDGDHGALSIKGDGTFEMTNASFNPLEYRDADDDFDATGTWRLARDDQELSLNFTTASQGDWKVEPSGFVVPFRSGSIHFFDPDETADIEFRLTTDVSD